jgi:ABC-type nitrate/sulfonate/bicarbonate transport system substrate-binding protein
MKNKVQIGRRELLLGVAATGFVAVAPPVIAQTKLTPMNIANSQGLASTTIATMMRQQKIFEQFGIEPNILAVSDGGKMVSALVSNQVDFATLSGFSQVFPAVEKGGKLKVIGSGGTVLSVLAMFTGKPDIKTLKDLEGRTVGSGAPGSLLYQLTIALLKKKGIDHSKIRFVNVGSSLDVFRAVSAGIVDAGLGDGNFTEEQEKYKVRDLPEGHLNTDLPEYTLQGSYTSDKAIETKRDGVVRTLAAYGKAFRLMQSPEGKAAFMQARAETAKSASAQENEAYWNYNQRTKPYGINLVISDDRLNYMQQLNMDFGVQSTILPLEKCTDMSIARDALKILGGPI